MYYSVHRSPRWFIFDVSEKPQIEITLRVARSKRDVDVVLG